MKEGVLIEKDNNGKPTSLTIDLRKHQEAIPALQELGFLEKKSFEERWENALTLEEAKEKTLQHIRNLFAKVHSKLNSGSYSYEVAPNSN